MKLLKKEFEWTHVEGRDSDGERLNRWLLTDSENRVYCRIFGPLYDSDTYLCEMWLEGHGFERHFLTLAPAQRHCEDMTRGYLEKQVTCSAGERHHAKPKTGLGFWRRILRQKGTEQTP